MQKTWTDPRTGVAWTVTVSPAGLRFPVLRPGLRTVAFHRSGLSPAWTQAPLIKELEAFSDQQLMDLLDRARREHHGHRLRRSDTAAESRSQAV